MISPRYTIYLLTACLLFATAILRAHGADLEPARQHLEKFVKSGDAAELQAIENEHRAGQHLLWAPLSSSDAAYSGPEAVAERMALFQFGLQVFQAIDARDAQLAAEYTPEDESALYRDYTVKRLVELIPSDDGLKFDPARLDLLDATLIKDTAAREDFIRKRDRYLHAGAVKKTRRELSYQYESIWRSYLEGVIAAAPQSDRPKMIESVMKHVPRESVRALLIPGYAGSPAPPGHDADPSKATPAPPPKGPASTSPPVESPLLPPANSAARNNSSTPAENATSGETNWWLVVAGAALAVAGAAVFILQRKKTP